MLPMSKALIWIVIIILLLWVGCSGYKFLFTQRSTSPTSSSPGGTTSVIEELDQFADYATGKTQMNRYEKVKKDLQLVSLQRTVHDAMTLYYLDKGKFPENLEDMANNDYISQTALNDNWGNKLESYVQDRKMILFSSGPDGRKGSTDDIKIEIPF
jgi:flagellar basal body-associated protein FliL